jgi:hypothetical protein
MRRLVLEISQKDLAKAGVEVPALGNIKSLDVLYFLRQDKEEFAVISKVQFKDSKSKIEDMLSKGFLVEAQTLRKEKDGSFIAFIRGGPFLSNVLSTVGVEGGYLFPPIGIGNGMVKFSFLGNEKQIKTFLARINKLKIRYKVILLTDANFSPDSPVYLLTEKQRLVLFKAHKMGYYDVPRRITTQELAVCLGVVNSTVVEHLRKAEQRLIEHILQQ